MHLREIAQIRLTFSSPFELAELSQGFNSNFRYLLIIFESFCFSSFIISPSVLKTNLLFSACAVVCAIVLLTSSQI